MSASIAAHVFMMLVYCAHGAHTCHVVYGHGEYPNLEECAQAAPAWVDAINRFDKRKVAGAFCELAGQPPASYTVERRAIMHANCGQLEADCAARNQAKTNAAQDP